MYCFKIIFLKFFLILCLIINFFPCGAVFAENSGIKVIIDGYEVEYDAQPELVNDRVMVPFRLTMERLGLTDIKWNEQSAKASGIFHNYPVILRIGNTQMFAKQTDIDMDTAPYLKDGRTMIPLRAVAEAFDASVSWDESANTVTINSRYLEEDYTFDEFDDKFIRISNNPNEYVDFVIEGNMLYVKGKITFDELCKVALFNSDKLLNITPVKSNEEFLLKINLSLINENNLKFILYTNTPETKYFNSYFSEWIEIDKNGRNYSFAKPQYYENNIRFSNVWEHPQHYNLTHGYSEIHELSDEICKGLETDYEKAFAIYKWVCENIYYNYDLSEKIDEYNKNYIYYSDEVNSVDRIYIKNILNKKTEVCEGIVRVMHFLLSSQNIPVKSITDSENLHIWLQVYADNRWINIDPTWGMSNYYKDGQYYEGRVNYIYFDCSNAFISYLHCISEVEKGF